MLLIEYLLVLVGYESPTWITILSDSYQVLVFLTAIIVASVAFGRFLIFKPIRTELTHQNDKLLQELNTQTMLLRTSSEVEIARLETVMSVNETRFDGNIKEINQSLEDLRKNVDRLLDKS